MKLDRISINGNDNKPIYQQIMEAIKNLIDNEQLKEDDQLPSARQLGEQLGVSMMTVRQAMRILIRNGYCYKVRGKGLFVRKKKAVINNLTFEGFTASIIHAKMKPETKYLSGIIEKPPEWVREGLELDDELAVSFNRLRLINDKPAILETEWFPEKKYKGLIYEDLSQSLYDILEKKYGIFITQTSDLILAYMPSQSERELLRLFRNYPVIARNRIGFTADGTPVEAVHSVYNPDKYDFRMNLYREGL